MNNTNNIQKMRIYPRYPYNADNIPEMQIISTEHGYPRNADNIHNHNKVTQSRLKNYHTPLLVAWHPPPLNIHPTTTPTPTTGTINHVYSKCESCRNDSPLYQQQCK